MGLLAAYVWTYWLAYAVLLLAVAALLGLVVGYYRKVVALEHTVRQLRAQLDRVEARQLEAAS
jgi:hypothetical protein